LAGIETAGLVLGAIPLITASLEAFQKGTPAFKNDGKERNDGEDGKESRTEHVERARLDQVRAG
jgi:hypothetical protein